MSFDPIDWQAPWYAPWRELGSRLAGSPDWIAEASHLAAELSLTNHLGLPVSFVPQTMLPPDVGYEAHVAATGQVPTRNNLHDFFNALAWLHFPLTKRMLNALHARALAEPVKTGTRGRQRDAATLFDENAALFITSDPHVAQALREHAWRPVLLRSPQAFAVDSDVALFGHALLEKLVAPYKSLTAHVWIVNVDAHWSRKPKPARMHELDALVSAAIDGGFCSADLCHLPVLGVPGWWPGQDHAFYNDVSVFRPRRIS